MALGAGFPEKQRFVEAFFKRILVDIADLPASVFPGSQTDHAVLARILGTEEKLLQIVLREAFLQILIEHALGGNAVTDDIGKNQLLRICPSKIFSQARILTGGSREKHSFSVFEVLFYLAVGKAYPALHIFGTAKG